MTKIPLSFIYIIFASFVGNVSLRELKAMKLVSVLSAIHHFLCELVVYRRCIFKIPAEKLFSTFIHASTTKLTV